MCDRSNGTARSACGGRRRRSTPLKHHRLLRRGGDTGGGGAVRRAGEGSLPVPRLRPWCSRRSSTGRGINDQDMAAAGSLDAVTRSWHTCPLPRRRRRPGRATADPSVSGSEVRGRSFGMAVMPSRKSGLRAESSSASASLAVCCSRGSLDPAAATCEPDGDGGGSGGQRLTSASAAESTSSAGTGVDQAPPRRHRRAAAIPWFWPWRRRGGEQPGGPAVGGEAAVDERLHHGGVVGDHGGSRRRAPCEPRCPPSTPARRHHRSRTDSSVGMRRCAWLVTCRWTEPVRGRSSFGWLRASKSAPPCLSLPRR